MGAAYLRVVASRDGRDRTTDCRITSEDTSSSRRCAQPTTPYAAYGGPDLPDGWRSVDLLHRSAAGVAAFQYAAHSRHPDVQGLAVRHRFGSAGVRAAQALRAGASTC